MSKSELSGRLLEKLEEILELDSTKKALLGQVAFTRRRILSLPVMILSFIIKGQRGFACGDRKLLSIMFAKNLFNKETKKVPKVEAYKQACDKLPAEFAETLVGESHRLEFSDHGEKYHGMKILVPDGTLCIVPRTQETIEKFGVGSGSTGDAYYPQARCVGFYELSTGTFEEFKFAHYKTPERMLMLEHVQANSVASLYMGDAGYNGIGLIAISNICFGQNVLIRSKEQSVLEKEFRKSRKKSAIYTITVTNVHLRNYPQFAHLKGREISIRMIRTKGTSKLRSMILVTTLLDEKEYKWQELSKLYLQRYKVELAFRHLKSKINIEKIKKIKLNRIMQLLHSAVLLFNLSSMLRNTVRSPSIMQERKGTKVYCLELCTEFVDLWFSAAMKTNENIQSMLELCLKSIEDCYSINRPWRTSPRICQFPASVFTRQKTSAKNTELQKVGFLKPEYEVLGNEYGML